VVKYSVLSCAQKLTARQLNLPHKTVIGEDNIKELKHFVDSQITFVYFEAVSCFQRMRRTLCCAFEVFPSRYFSINNDAVVAVCCSGQ